MLVNTGDEIVSSAAGLLSTIAWQTPNGEVNYALEGSVFIAGAAVQWLRDGLELIDSASEIENLAASVADSGGIVFVPALTGLGAPHWDPNAKGAILGITRGTTKAHLARATLEAIALQVRDLSLAIESDLSSKLLQLRVDGGAAANNLLMQLQSDLLGVDVVRGRNLESTATGAAFLAGLGSGVWSDYSQLKEAFESDRVFSPSARHEDLISKWNLSVSTAKQWR